MVPEDELEGFREYELSPLIRSLLPTLLGAVRLIDNPRIRSERESGRILRPDLMALLADGSLAIIEIKGVTPNTQPRLEDVVQQLTSYKKAYAKSNFSTNIVSVFVTPGTLSKEYRAFLRSHGIDRVIDGEVFRRAEHMRAVSSLQLHT